ncbi:hypothetical protein M422DRAFT_244821, partial [Sphaerobolus stellatus SS14]
MYRIPHETFAQIERPASPFGVPLSSTNRAYPRRIGRTTGKQPWVKNENKHTSNSKPQSHTTSFDRHANRLKQLNSSNIPHAQRKAPVLHPRIPSSALSRDKPIKLLSSRSLPEPIVFNPLTLYRPSSQKLISLASHCASLPKIPSPLSPRARLTSRPVQPQPGLHTPTPPKSSTAKHYVRLSFIKTFWDYRRAALAAVQTDSNAPPLPQG